MLTFLLGDDRVGVLSSECILVCLEDLTLMFHPLEDYLIVGTRDSHMFPGLH